jgi:hypothetical protein
MSGSPYKDAQIESAVKKKRQKNMQPRKWEGKDMHETIGINWETERIWSHENGREQFSER